MPLQGREKVTKMTEGYYTKVNKDVRGVFIAGLVNIVEGTPVDTGRARNNWFLSVGAPSKKVIKTKGKGLGAIKSISKMPDRVLNKPLFYTNNLPYIETLEYGRYKNPNKGTKTKGGYSKQAAPKGWVRVTLIAMANKIRSL